MTLIQDFDLVDTPLEGMNLIEAGAGTGKTYASRRVGWCQE